MYQMFASLRILTDMIVRNNVVGKEGQPRQEKNRSFEFKSSSQFIGSFGKDNNLTNKQRNYYFSSILPVALTPDA